MPLRYKIDVTGRQITVASAAIKRAPLLAPSLYQPGKRFRSIPHRRWQIDWLPVYKANPIHYGAPVTECGGADKSAGETCSILHGGYLVGYMATKRQIDRFEEVYRPAQDLRYGNDQARRAGPRAVGRNPRLLHLMTG